MDSSTPSCVSFLSPFRLAHFLFRWIYIYILSVVIVSISHTASSIRLFLWNKTWIHYSFIQMYLSSAACAWPLSARLSSHCASVIHPSYGPVWKHHDVGEVGGGFGRGTMECILAMWALTRVVREAVKKIPLGDSPVITIAVCLLKITVVCEVGLYKAIKHKDLPMHGV